MTIHQQLIDAGTKYRKELLTMPVATLAEVLQYMSLKTGLQGKEVGGQLEVEAHLRPYRTAKDASDGVAITPYEWETFLGDCVKEFDPNAILGTLYTEATSKKPNEREIARLVALAMAGKVGEGLYDVLFTAVRNPAGNESADLFNGFSTLAAKAVADNKLTVALGNYKDISGTTLTVANCGDILKAEWRALNKKLKKLKLNLYLPTSVLEMYEDWFQIEYGHAPWNEGVEQKTLVGSKGKCTFVALDNMEDQDYLFFTIKENMKVGVDQESDKENVRIRECDNPKMVQFFMMAFFGTGFDTLDARFMKVLKFAKEE